MQRTSHFNTDLSALINQLADDASADEFRGLCHSLARDAEAAEQLFSAAQQWTAYTASLGVTLAKFVDQMPYPPPLSEPPTAG